MPPPLMKEEKQTLSRAATFSDKSFSWRHRIRKYRGLKVHFINKRKVIRDRNYENGPCWFFGLSFAVDVKT